MFSGYIRQNFEIFVELCNSGAMTHVAPGIELPRFLMCHCTKGLEKAVFYMRRQAHLKSSFLNTIPLLDFRTAMVNKHEWITGVRYSCFSLMRGSRENIEDNSVVYEVGVRKTERGGRWILIYLLPSDRSWCKHCTAAQARVDLILLVLSVDMMMKKGASVQFDGNIYMLINTH